MFGNWCKLHSNLIPMDSLVLKHDQKEWKRNKVGSRIPFVIRPRVLESYHLKKHPAYLHPGVEETILDPTHVNAKPPSSPPEGPFVPATSVAPPGQAWERNRAAVSCRSAHKYHCPKSGNNRGHARNEFRHSMPLWHSIQTKKSCSLFTLLSRSPFDFFCGVLGKGSVFTGGRSAIIWSNLSSCADKFSQDPGFFVLGGVWLAPARCCWDEMSKAFQSHIGWINVNHPNFTPSPYFQSIIQHTSRLQIHVWSFLDIFGVFLIM